MNNIIEIKNISKRYGDHSIIENYSRTFESGKIYMIAGASGSGKSTLLNMISLMDQPNEGEILYNNIQVNKLRGKKKREILRKDISYLFQNYALVDSDKVSDNISIGLKFTNLNTKEVIAKSLEKVNLEGFSDRIVYTLSGGEQQRVALARLLYKPFFVLFADEPTGNLDEGNAEIVFSIFKELRDQGKIIIVATHDPELLKIADEVIKI